MESAAGRHRRNDPSHRCSHPVEQLDGKVVINGSTTLRQLNNPFLATYTDGVTISLVFRFFQIVRPFAVCCFQLSRVCQYIVVRGSECGFGRAWVLHCSCVREGKISECDVGIAEATRMVQLMLQGVEDSGSAALVEHGMMQLLV